MKKTIDTVPIEITPMPFVLHVPRSSFDGITIETLKRRETSTRITFEWKR